MPKIMDFRTKKCVFCCGPGGGEKLFDPWASGRKGQECPREIRTKKFMFVLFFSSLNTPLSVTPLSRVAPANQTKEGSAHELFAGAFRNKSSICESCLFYKEKHTRIHREMGEIHELFVLALSLVWFAGTTPDPFKCARVMHPCQHGCSIEAGCDQHLHQKLCAFHRIHPEQSMLLKGYPVGEATCSVA